MTNETKQLFGAPWTSKYWCVTDVNARNVATSPSQKDATRIALLPELYDIAKTAIEDRCKACNKCLCLQCKVNRWKATMKRIKEA